MTTSLERPNRGTARRRLTTAELLERMHREDARAVKVVGRRLDRIAAVVEIVGNRLAAGGRLHYFGAGTSGRLAALDAFECGPTFGVDADLVVAHVAADGAGEDDAARGRADARGARLRANDVAVGVSASGETRYVLAAVEFAAAAGALTVAIVNASDTPLAARCELAIELDTGPEVIAGSTRLKAGTAQKLALNMLSTGIFHALGHTYRGRMIDVVASNEKLRRRAAALVADLTGEPAPAIRAALEASGWSAKLAVLMLRCALTADAARDRLDQARGDLAVALGEA
jgi:N-acetylmuramic acid 6-phosphate etherase